MHVQELFLMPADVRVIWVICGSKDCIIHADKNLLSSFVHGV